MTRNIAIVGLGPRGMSTLERIVENARLHPHSPVVVHAIDAESPGAGSVWRPTQSWHLLMNTVASQVTLFNDTSVRCRGPIVPGPSLYEWIQRGGADELDDPELRAQAARLAADDYPTRALYGRYLHWVLDHVRAGLPANVRLHVHTDRVLAVTALGSGGYAVVPSHSTQAITVDKVVLALGHLPASLRERERRLEAFAITHGLQYIPPANPADIDLADVTERNTVLVNGLGLNFFDYLSLLTSARGGRFDETTGGLVYRPSGTEPRIVAGSRRGVPYHARGANQKGVTGRHVPRFLTPETIERLRARARGVGGLDFYDDVWPHITNEVAFVYYCAMARQSDPAADRRAFATELVTALTHGPEHTRPLLRRHGIGGDTEWNWDCISRPLGEGVFASPEAFTDRLLAYLREDLVNSYGGNVDNPIKSALDALRDLRNEVRQVIDHGQLTAASYREHVSGFYTPLNAFVSIGPPPRRIAELIALIEAGIVTVAGPGFSATADPRGHFTGTSPAVVGAEYTGDVLIDARLPDPGVVGSDDPLVRYLLDSGIGRRHRLRTNGTEHVTGGLEVTDRPYRLVDACGRPNPGVHAFGVPTEGVHWATAAGVRPGVDSVILGDADAIARSVLGLDDPPDGDHDVRHEAVLTSEPHALPAH
ncbi:FAD/NAD(P)-binding protein [Nocardiopsis gilva]